MINWLRAEWFNVTTIFLTTIAVVVSVRACQTTQDSERRAELRSCNQTLAGYPEKLRMKSFDTTKTLLDWFQSAELPDRIDSKRAVSELAVDVRNLRVAVKDAKCPMEHTSRLTKVEEAIMGIQQDLKGEKLSPERLDAFGSAVNQFLDESDYAEACCPKE